MTTLLADVVATSAAVAATRSRTAKVAAIADRLRAASHEELPTVASYLAGRPRQERLDVGWALLGDLDVAPAPAPSLSVLDVHAALERLAWISGAGSRQARRDVLTGLLRAATSAEQVFLRGLVLGELRQGALEGSVLQAVAVAAGVDDAAVRRAAMLSGDLGAAATAALEGEVALAAVRLTPLRAVLPMLASTAATADAALEGLDRAAVEHKLDGARVQVHRLGGEVRAYTRNLRDATGRVPAVVEAVRALPVRSIVLDGEALAVRDDGRPEHFQDSMSGFGRSKTPSAVTVRPFFFDVLHLDGEDLLDAPLSERWDRLAAVIPEHERVQRTVADTGADVADALDAAVGAGHEGLVVKDLASPYQAGRRGSAWRKLKIAHTFDLVVLGVEWGHGRRRGLLSNLHLGARDPDGGFVMLGKTFKGLTDEVLTWQTQRFLELETHRDDHVVYVRPEQVVEVAIDGVQASTRYPGGVALRFARVKRYRDDKSPSEADTIDTIRALRTD